ncbi:MAG: glucokinase, partial [Pseudomonadales bacterium]|nr:glucokinase [Pseudomonadales bacterium]
MIVGDIGGTKTQLAYMSESPLQENKVPELLHLKRYRNDEHDCFEAIITDYLMETGARQPQSMVLAVAGPVRNNHCQLTNLPWELDTTKLSQELNIDRVLLLNDLAATAYAIPHLPAEDFTWIQTSDLPENDTQSVVSIGTGLGEAALVYNESRQLYDVVPGEGGHKNFAPADEEQLELLSYYLQTCDQVSIENLASGLGLSKIYEFLKQHPEWCDEVPDMKDADSSKNINELITQLAFELPGSIYEETMLLFSRMIMSEAGNAALQTYSNGGVVLAGGIPPKIIK